MHGWLPMQVLFLHFEKSHGIFLIFRNFYHIFHGIFVFTRNISYVFAKKQPARGVFTPSDRLMANTIKSGNRPARFA